MPRKVLANWGNYPRAEAEFLETSALRDVLKFASTPDVIARGNGRCYGDASLGERVLSTLRLDKFLEFDPETGAIDCQSGVLLSDILDVVVPRGFFLPVTPGTKFITVGGAVAADVHGKNHHVEGTFSNHVISFDLMTADGSVVRCSRDENTDLFWQTCGGMGLTGVIVSVRFRLKRIETAFISQRTIKAADLDAVMKGFDANSGSTYSVAWIDCLASGKDRGRSHLILGEHTLISELPTKYSKDPLATARQSSLAVPINLPAFALNGLTVRTFNSLYFNRIRADEVDAVVHFDGYFYPLDGIRDWNRAYGKRGFIQYQCVIPTDNSYDGMTAILDKIAASGEGSPLAVLKLFGKPDPNAVMSFPIEGYTLALDFKVSDKVFRLLDDLDDIVLKNGGRIYLAKDARMKPEMFARTYDQKVRSGHFASLQSKRLQI